MNVTNSVANASAKYYDFPANGGHLHRRERELRQQGAADPGRLRRDGRLREGLRERHLHQGRHARLRRTTSSSSRPTARRTRCSSARTTRSSASSRTTTCACTTGSRSRTATGVETTEAMPTASHIEAAILSLGALVHRGQLGLRRQDDQAEGVGGDRADVPRSGRHRRRGRRRHRGPQGLTTTTTGSSFRSPPYFLDPIAANWKVLRTNEQVPPGQVSVPPPIVVPAAAGVTGGGARSAARAGRAARGAARPGPPRHGRRRTRCASRRRGWWSSTTRVLGGPLVHAARLAGPRGRSIPARRRPES